MLRTDEVGTADNAQHVAQRGLYECEAKSVATVLAGLAGLDTVAYSFGYVTTWTKGDVTHTPSTLKQSPRDCGALHVSSRG